MVVRDIFELLQSLEMIETRCILENYGEVVFEKKYIEDWIGGLMEVLGAPKKSAGENPTEKDMALTKDYRGIRRDQTLFHKQYDGYGILAMLWPWSTGNVTLIIAKIVE